MVIDRRTEGIDHRHVRDLPQLIQPRDRVVLNDTKVIAASLRGTRQQTGGRWQGLYLGDLPDGSWRLICKTRGRLNPPEAIFLHDREGREMVKLWLIERLEEGHWRARPDGDLPTSEVLQLVGRPPLPPYIRGGNMVDADVERYQTVYARRPGAVAAPTAGLHFSERLLRQLETAGTTFSAVTLHVGQGTFQPVAVEDPADHTMHAEWGELSSRTAAELAATRREGGRVLAVGTTVVRVLETAAASEGGREPGSGWCGTTELFIRPPYEFRAIDMLLTNFHFPRSTLLLLVQAFAGTQLLREAYHQAIKQEYRFYSYGDAMLIL
jgi:S-adenosylmethionine:tRNA ribosyltransferase-isomerase